MGKTTVSWHVVGKTVLFECTNCGPLGVTISGDGTTLTLDDLRAEALAHMLFTHQIGVRA